MFVIYHKEKGNVITAYDKDDTIVPEDYEKIEITGKMRDFIWPDAPFLCKVENGEIVANATGKVEFEQAQRVNVQKRQSAVGKLRGLGLSEEEIDALFR